MTGPATLNALEAARRPLAVTGTTRTLGLADAGAYLRFTNTSTKTCTVPPQSDVAWVDAIQIPIRNGPTGDLTIVAGSGVSIEAPGSGSLVLQPRMTAMLYRVSEDTWHLIGQTVLV